MDEEERAILKAMGYAVVDDATDWLGLDEIERQLVDLRVRLGREVRRRRAEAGLTQGPMADPIGTAQPRAAKLEGAAEGDGLDLLMRAFFASGGKIADLASI